jgi:hypothetical protein
MQSRIGVGKQESEVKKTAVQMLQLGWSISLGFNVHRMRATTVSAVYGIANITDLHIGSQGSL